MTVTGDREDTLLTELERVIARMQKIQRDIRASRQPASMFEIARLKDLGHEYAALTARLEVVVGSVRHGRD
jgi:hypothetical protein